MDLTSSPSTSPSQRRTLHSKIFSNPQNWPIKASAHETHQQHKMGHSSSHHVPRTQPMHRGCIHYQLQSSPLRGSQADPRSSNEAAQEGSSAIIKRHPSNLPILLSCLCFLQMVKSSLMFASHAHWKKMVSQAPLNTSMEKQHVNRR